MAVSILALAGRPAAQRDLHAPLDKILDMYVRDGNVYYAALQKARAPLDAYIRSLDLPAATVAAWSKADREAFWLNAYDAIVLQTVIDAYPIHGGAPEYPENSIRQIPGAFSARTHQIAGRALTLDAIERDMLTTFGDARLALAVGRGAEGGGRLRSEAYRGAALEGQLTEVVKECAAHVACVKVDRVDGWLEVTPIVGWDQQAFIETFGATVPGGPWADRSPIERAVAKMVSPYLFQDERRFLGQDKFQMKYGQFDWRLNDMTRGIPN